MYDASLNPFEYTPMAATIGASFALDGARGALPGGGAAGDRSR